MRAVIVAEPGGSEVMQVGEVETPQPGPGEVLLSSVASGVNRADILQRRGHYPPPRGTTDILGLEVSGIIEAIGDGVTSHQVGDEVVALLAGGGYAEYVVAPEGQVIAPPASVDLVTAGGLLEVAATVVSNFDEARLQSGETVLIHGGAGGIGTFAIQYAKALGCRVATTAGSARKLEHCTQYGADIVLDYHDDWVQGLKGATDSRGADVILDIIGAKYLESNVGALARGGRLVVIGLQGGTKGTLNLGQLLAKQGSVAATSLRFRPTEGKAAICARVAETVWPLLESGQILPAPETRIPFDEAPRAHDLLDGGDNVGKIVLVH